MKLGTVTKQPAERFSYTIDYSEALTAGDNITAVTASVSPAGMTVDNVGAYDPVVRFWAAGGESGSTHKVTVTVTTDEGRVFQDEVAFKIKEV